MHETAEVLFILLVTLWPVAFLFFRAKRKREEEEEQERADALMSKNPERAATYYTDRLAEGAKVSASRATQAKRRAQGSSSFAPVSPAYQGSCDEGFSASDAELVAMALSSGSRSDSALLWSGSGGSFSGGGASGSWDSGSSSLSDCSSSDSSSSYSSD